MLTKKEIVVGLVSLVLGAVLFGELELTGAAENETKKTEENLFTIIDPWANADLDPTKNISGDTTPPTIEIISPLDSTVYAKDTENITIELKAADDSGSIKLEIQNLDTTGQTRQTYPVDASNHIENFSLYPGWNTILALARDPAGNVSTSFILVERTGTPPPTPTQSPKSEPTTTQRSRYRDGTYEGTGYYTFGTAKYPLTTQITIVKGRIKKLVYLKFPISGLVTSESFLDPMRNQLLAQQNTKIDTISGATGTSEAFLNATREALNKAE